MASIKKWILRKLGVRSPTEVVFPAGREIKEGFTQAVQEEKEAGANPTKQEVFNRMMEHGERFRSSPLGRHRWWDEDER